MKKSRPDDSDIFVRRPMVALRANLYRLDIAAEADVAGLEPFMEAAVAAAMIIAHADGKVDVTERRRIIALFRAAPMLRGFSADDIVCEIASHSRAFELDYPGALAHAQSQIATADLSREQFRALIAMCISVIEADGVRHASEEHALAGISAIQSWGER